ncbi:MAG TPA: LysR family transcriptional regulator, partial [Gammaproteobacteria bacterium]|nr:LysR family transcriptional regulator [Gammaproteobacteria bacterium]
ADRASVRIQELLEYPYICREEGSGTREVISEYMGQEGINDAQVNLTMELGSPESIKGAVEAGMGISIISRATVLKELQLGTLVALPLEPALERPFSFVHQKQKFRHRAMDELLEFARAYCKSHPDAV